MPTANQGPIPPSAASSSPSSSSQQPPPPPPTPQPSLHQHPSSSARPHIYSHPPIDLSKILNLPVWKDSASCSDRLHSVRPDADKSVGVSPVEDIEGGRVGGDTGSDGGGEVGGGGKSPRGVWRKKKSEVASRGKKDDNNNTMEGDVKGKVQTKPRWRN